MQFFRFFIAVSIASTFRSLYFTSIVKQICRLLCCYLCFSLHVLYLHIQYHEDYTRFSSVFFYSPPSKFLLDQQTFLLGRRTPCYQLGGTSKERAILLLPQQKNASRGVKKQQKNSKVFLDSCILLLIVRRTQQKNSISGSRYTQPSERDRRTRNETICNHL